MENVKAILQNNGIELIELTLENKGYYNCVLKMMFVNQELDEFEKLKVILHETGHALKHSDYMILYNLSTYKSKMEYEANQYMLKYLINESDGHYNYSNVIESFNLGLGWEFK
ncbi:ImmA/IrrE family metallo-endopeptidase [Enterococcus sp. 22-H-5-01]|uniref:ImmA/IrrE family metallo-endopeptidase n=1 Tax=Enterococcus sp. 22-H-5-01 TaxID=3418555 RepID=UPI003D04D54B